MQIRPTQFSPATNTQGVQFPSTSGGTSPGAGEGVRADWQVRMNMSHSRGFVGGAGRLLIHNEAADEMDHIVLLLPAAVNHNEPDTLRLLSATIVSAKPGMPAQPGAPLVIQATGARVAITIPTLNMNDWIYIDMQWDGSFPVNGVLYPGGVIPIGKFHPQLAFDVDRAGQIALYPIPARYDVTLATDVGTKVMMQTEGTPVSNVAPDGQSTEHTFSSFGNAEIKAGLAAPGSVVHA